jgi:uncharacterized protein with HEPN domain
MRTAADDARRFVQGMSKEDFLADKRTQQAVTMSLVVIGEAAAKIMDQYCEFAAAHPEVAWLDMRGMRNRIAHGYFDVDLDVVWNTVQTAAPDLLGRVGAVTLKVGLRRALKAARNFTGPDSSRWR